MQLPDKIVEFYEDKFLPTSQDIENYMQLSNACGLASILMLAQLNKHKNTLLFLEKISDLIEPLIKEVAKYSIDDVYKLKEYKLQYAAQYLLLKAFSETGWEFLYDYLKENAGEEYINQKALHLYYLREQLSSLYRDSWKENIHGYENYLLHGGLVNANPSAGLCLFLQKPISAQYRYLF